MSTSDDPTRLLTHLLTAPIDAAPVESVDLWWQRHQRLRSDWPATIDLAIAGGLAADRVAWAFCTAYQAALRQLVPSLPADVIAALCATEETGNSPKAIRTALKAGTDGGWQLSGHKKWTTLGPASARLLVVARRDDADSPRPVRAVVGVAGSAAGVTLKPMPPTRFVPEAPHAQVQLADVAVGDADILPGDGYERYLKPFRTIEDIHVQAGVVAYLLREARLRDWPQAFVEQALAALLALRALGAAEPLAAATHIALAGALQQTAALFDAAERCWADDAGPPLPHERWQRDRSLVSVAGTVRALRRERAWERLRG